MSMSVHSNWIRVQTELKRLSVGAGVVAYESMRMADEPEKASKIVIVDNREVLNRILTGELFSFQRF